MTSTAAWPGAVVVTGANGFVGSRVCSRLATQGVPVRAVVRRAGTAPPLDGVQEVVGDVADLRFLAWVVRGAEAVVSAVHPMGAPAEVQRRVAVEGTPLLARAARDTGVPLLVHVSTAAVYDRSPGVGDVDESSALVGSTADAYAAAKRDTDLALAEVEGVTRVVVRPAAILGAGRTSLWNTLRPRQMRDDEQQRHSVPGATFAWVHVDDLAVLVADLVTGRIPLSADAAAGPLPDGCTAVDVGTASATRRDYFETVCGALGVEPVWDDRPAWTGRFLSRRARGWGWAPRVSFEDALLELEQGVCALAGSRSGEPAYG